MIYVFVFALGLAVSSTGYAETGLVVGPYLQDWKPDGITVMWETKTPSVGWVDYGLSTDLGQTAGGVSAITHEIKLRDLASATRYYYRIRWQEGQSDIHWFKTAPPVGHRNLRLIAYGDSRSDPKTHGMIIHRILELNPDVVLNSGDLVQDGNRYEQWKPMHFDPAFPLMKNLCMFTVPGNHEKNSPEFFQYFSQPEGSGSEHYWSTDFANVHLVGLDSNVEYCDSHPGSPQYEWLKKDLISTNQEWKIVVFHHPMFSFHPARDINQVRWDWQPLFQETGVDLVLVGHDHHYGRTFPIGPFGHDPARGVVHITSGGGGANLYPTHDFGYSAARQATYNLVVLDILEDRIVGRALDHKGNGLDSFVIDKKMPVTKENYISYEMIQIEKELNEKARNQPPQTAPVEGFELKNTLETSVVFGATVTAEVRKQENPHWAVQANPPKQILPPETPFKAEVSAKRLSADSPIYPLPKVKVLIYSDEAARDFRDPITGFRNTSFELLPFHVFQSQKLTVPVNNSLPLLDGKLDASEWSQALVVDEFFDTRTTEYPTNQTTVHLLKSNQGDLFVGMSAQQLPGFSERQPYARPDDSYLLRNEHFCVHLAVGDTMYGFLISANGYSADFKGKEAEWDLPGFEATAIGTADGWEAELKIPLPGLGAESPIKANLRRFDLATTENSEWIPTYGTFLESSEYFGELE